jgi:hypothetical protein
MATVNKCRPTALGSNLWCLKDLFSKGEGTDLIFLPVSVWGQMKQLWLTTAGGDTGPMILAEEAGASVVSYLYNEPAADIETTLFPAGAIEKSGLFFPGNALIFNPTLGNSTDAQGVPYQTSNFSLPVGSSRAYDELVQYLQSKAWVAIKVSSDAQAMHIYGGPRGFFPKADEISEMLFSGNNDDKGKTTAVFEVAKSNFAIEYLKIGTQTDSKNALLDLMGYIKDGACLENGEVTTP